MTGIYACMLIFKRAFNKYTRSRLFRAGFSKNRDVPPPPDSPQYNEFSRMAK